MRSYILILFLICFTGIYSNEDSLLVATTNKANVQADTLSKDSIKHFDLAQLDYLTGLLYDKPGFFEPDSLVYANLQIHRNELPKTSLETLNEELALLPTIISLRANNQVKKVIDYYVYNRRLHVSRLLGKSAYYLPIFRAILDREDMPIELAYLPVVESALNNDARSYMGAVGPWQIMPATAEMLGLTFNSLVDERMNYIKATEAAIQYLRKLYTIYDDWLLAIAAYNAGPGNINKAIAKSGGKNNYWSIYSYLPKETQMYVPSFIATIYAMEYASKYNIYPSKPSFDFTATKDVLITEKISLQHLSNTLGINLDVLRFINPELKKDIIPKTENGYKLNIPIEYVAMYYQYEANILYDPRFEEDNSIEEVVYIEPDKNSYTVTSGDNLGYIAEKFDVSISDIKRWNGLKGDFLKVGQRLTIYADEPKFSNNSEPQSNSNNNFVGVKREDMDRKNCGCRYHVVKEGDTLWDISMHYGASIEKIKADNNIGNTSRLKLGTILKIDI